METNIENNINEIVTENNDTDTTFSDYDKK